MLNQLNEKTITFSDEELVSYAYTAFTMGVILTNILIIISLLKKDPEHNNRLEDFNQDGMSENGKTPIENSILEHKLEDKLSSIYFPDEFICRISKKLILNPAFNTNGDTFDWEPYKNYLALNNNIDIITNEKLNDITLRPNIVLRKQIIDFLDNYAKPLQPIPAPNMLNSFTTWIQRSIAFAPVEDATARHTPNRHTPLLS